MLFSGDIGVGVVLVHHRVVGEPVEVVGIGFRLRDLGGVGHGRRHVALRIRRAHAESDKDNHASGTVKGRSVPYRVFNASSISIMISSFSYRTHREKESLEPIEKNHHAAKELDKETDGEKTAIAVGEVISEAVAEESSVCDPPSKIDILEWRTQVYEKQFHLWKNSVSLR